LDGACMGGLILVLTTIDLTTIDLTTIDIITIQDTVEERLIIIPIQEEM
jgi:hypothetical protein